MPTRAMIPPYEDPIFRFLMGIGELNVHPNGAFTLWEALVGFSDSQFPIEVGDRKLSKQELLIHAANMFNGGVFDRAERVVGRNGLEKIKEICRQAGLAECF